MTDGQGVCGFIFHYACLFALFGSAFLAFFYAWKKQRLDFEDELNKQPFWEEQPYDDRK